MELSIGQTFADYEILGVLGAGGMGKVYKVRNKISDRVEAMKILLSSLAVENELADRFTREIRIFGSLNHPNITELRTALRVDNQLVMIMEYVEGSSLDVLMKQGRIPQEKYCDYMCQALSALSYAHSKGVVHRDIKPANMMLTPAGVIKLMDFGIAKAVTDPQLTKTGLVVGSVFYISPEQIEGKDIDARSDLYSLGITLYELATGRRPFDGNSDYQIISAHIMQPPSPPSTLDPSLPADLNDIILTALQKDPAKRFQTADAFRNALGSLGGASQIGVSQVGASQVSPARPAPQTADLTTFSPVRPVVSPAPPVASPNPPPVTLPPPVASPLPRAVAAPPPAAIPIAPPATQVAGRANNRLIYMLLGSAATIAVLVAAFIEVPKIMQTNAAEKTQTTQSTPPPKPEIKETAPAQPQPVPVTTPPAQEPAPKPVETAKNPAIPEPARQLPSKPAAEPAVKVPAKSTPPVQPVAQPAIQPVSQPVAQRTPTPAQPPPSQPPAVQTPPQPNAAPANAAELAQLRERSNLMSIRVATIRASFENFKRQQAAAGHNPRSDMVAADSRLAYQLDMAEASMQKGDTVEAKKRMDAAERELEKLESFLGK